MLIKDTALFDNLNEEKQMHLLSDVFLSDESNAVAEMLDNETILNVVSIIHKAWRQKKGIDLAPSEYHPTDLMHDIIISWDRCLYRTLSKNANNELLFMSDAIDPNEEY